MSVKNEATDHENLDRAIRKLNEAKDAIDEGYPATALDRVDQVKDILDIVSPPKKQLPIMHYVYQQIKNLEVKTGFVIVLQFATHPSGNLAMVFRAHNPRTGVEAPPISDVIFLQEVEENAKVIPRLEVLFENIHKALNSIQTINPKSMMEVIH